MAYKYLEHEADVGIIGIGTSLEEAFQEGAKGMFNVMVEIEKVEALKEIAVECQANDIEGLYVEWLNQLVAKKDTEDMFFSEFKVSIEEKDGKFYLKGSAKGETQDQKKHNIKTEVKGATYSGLSYEEKNGKHYVQCVVDV